MLADAHPEATSDVRVDRVRHLARPSDKTNQAFGS